MKIRTSQKFDKEVKRLSKKHKSVLEDLGVLTESLIDNPTQGQSLGKGCYKVRMTISSKNQGKSGGARVITLVQIIDDLVVLLSIYDKSEKDTVSDLELDDLINDFNTEEED
jgi:mRNA-degrading endonuclease RelE of RelBE toxin-antitoxin system